MFTVEKVHAQYFIVKDGSFAILYVNIAKDGTMTFITEDEGITLQQLLGGVAAFTAEHMEVK